MKIKSFDQLRSAMTDEQQKEADLKSREMLTEMLLSEIRREMRKRGHT